MASANFASNSKRLYSTTLRAPITIHHVSKEMDQLYLIFRQVRILIEVYTG